MSVVADPRVVVDHTAAVARTAAVAAVVADHTAVVVAHTARVVVDIGFRMAVGLRVIVVDMETKLVRGAAVAAAGCIPIAIEGTVTVCHMRFVWAQESRRELRRWGREGVQEDSVGMELSSAGTR